MGSDRRNFARPLWLGSPDIAGKTILLHAEQGFGDTIQFCRYAPLVAARGAQVILEVQEPLRELASRFGASVEVVSRGLALPDFDLHCPLLSLPLAFSTTLATIPSATPYLGAECTGCRGLGNAARLVQSPPDRPRLVGPPCPYQRP